MLKTLLIATKINDLSIPLFLSNRIKSKIKIDFCFFHETKNDLKEKLKNKYDYIYIRDPFNYVYEEHSDINTKVNLILENAKDSYLIDSIKSMEDIYFEDKWEQYKIFKEFMPETALLKNIKDVDNKKKFTKKRISSRAKGVVFSSKELIDKNPTEYIIQNKLKIDKEYRVYVIFNKIIKNVALKTPKNKNSKVEIYGIELIEKELMDFIKKIIKKNKFDFIGLDIVKSSNKLFLLEINRSCFFNGFFRETGVNLAESFIDNLLLR